MAVLKENLVKVVAANRPIFFQGFPRDFEQAAHFEDEVRVRSLTKKITLEERIEFNRKYYGMNPADMEQLNSFTLRSFVQTDRTISTCFLPEYIRRHLEETPFAKQQIGGPLRRQQRYDSPATRLV